MKRVMHRLFWAWDFDREEDWLNAWAARGLALVDVCGIRYVFEEGAPGEYEYRLELLEHTVQQISDLTTSVEKLAISMEGMLREQEKQGRRLETLEDRDGAMWRKIVAYGATAIVGIFIGYIAQQLGLN